MSRVRFDAQAAGRVRRALDEAQTPESHAWRRGVACLLVLFVVALHGLDASGSLPTGRDGPVRRVRTASRLESDVRESSEMNLIRVGAAAVVFTGLVSSASAVEILVPEQYPTIAAAFAACGANDVVSVAPGLYNVGLITMPTVPLTLRGRGLQAETVLVGESIQVFAGNGPRVLENLTLRGMTGYGAIHVDQASAVLRSVVIEDSTTIGVFLNTNATVETANCTFRQLGKGGGAYVNSFWTATDCTFEGGNSVGSYGGAVGFHVGSGCNFLRCSFIGNSASQGGAIGLSFSGTRVFDQCYFEGNSSANGNVWWTEYGATGTLKNSVLCGHSPSDFSGSWIDGGGNQFFPKGCSAPCPADLVDDGVVNAADMAVVLNFWGTNGSQFPGVDLNSDGVVNAADLSQLLNSWGACPE